MRDAEASDGEDASCTTWRRSLATDLDRRAVAIGKREGLEGGCNFIRFGEFRDCAAAAEEEEGYWLENN